MWANLIALNDRVLRCNIDKVTFMVPIRENNKVFIDHEKKNCCIIALTGNLATKPSILISPFLS